jgi:hypothetical protein
MKGKINMNNEKKPLEKLQEEVKKVKKNARDFQTKQSKKIGKLEDQLKEYSAYKQLIITASKANNNPQKIVEGLRFTAKNIEAKNWPMVDRVGGSSGDLEARGACPVCHINLVGKDRRPRDLTFPCGVTGCPYETKEVTL